MVMKLLSRMGALEDCGASRALDVPAGEGRMTRYLQSMGFHAVGADLSLEMTALGQRRGMPAGSSVVGDIEGRLPFIDESFDLVLCWRLLHHLPSQELLMEVFKELARVSKKWVVLSFFHPISLHNFSRIVNRLLGSKSWRFTHHHRHIIRTGRAANLKPCGIQAQAPFLRDLWAAAFLKETISPKGSGIENGGFNGV
jgi:SAM-dependent methyltransferase